MSLRLILASVLLFIFSLIAGMAVAVAHYAIVVGSPTIPQVTEVFMMIVPTLGFIWGLVGAFLFVLAILFLVLYLIIDRMFVNPVLTISKTLTSLSQQGDGVEVPQFSLKTQEMRNLADAFVKFANRVNAVHSRDMEISRVKSDFITTAAHQIRTPLTGIRWALEALEKEPLTDMQMQIVKNAVDKSRDLVAIIGTLLDISSIESGKYKYKFEVSNLGPLAESVASDFLQFAKEHNVSLLYEKSTVPLPPVKMDTERIKWILNNLFENAIRYTPAGGSVTLATKTISDRVIVQVKDTGIGIPETDRNNIFERFYRAGNAIAKENAGNGLGLYIARTIATDHGGDLNFQSNSAGVGTTFTLSLPVAH